jgi:hypothetical protein
MTETPSLGELLDAAQAYADEKRARWDEERSTRAHAVVCELCKTNQHSRCVRPCTCRHAPES